MLCRYDSLIDLSVHFYRDNYNYEHKTSISKFIFYYFYFMTQQRYLGI